MNQNTPENAQGPSEEALETGRLLFAKECSFVMGVARIDDLPADILPEVAFAGRSNVGKSSLINAHQQHAGPHAAAQFFQPR
jgi:GTP-binding protein